MDELKKLYEDMYEGMIHKNIAYLTQIYDPSFTLTHMTGHKQTREAYFHDILTDALGYRSAVHERVDVSQQNGQTILTDYSRVRAAIYGLPLTTYRLKLTFTCQKKAGQWVLMDCVASSY